LTADALLRKRCTSGPAGYFSVHNCSLSMPYSRPVLDNSGGLHHCSGISLSLTCLIDITPVPSAASVTPASGSHSRLWQPLPPLAATPASGSHSRLWQSLPPRAVTPAWSRRPLPPRVVTPVSGSHSRDSVSHFQCYCRWHDGRDTSSANRRYPGICLEHMIVALDFHGLPVGIVDC
jgi:hypothetical protein